jgi:glycosyltransferase involved in cell wall biosynthesis
MRLAVVTLRYGADVVGGAETLARDYVGRLAAAGHEVEVLTLCIRNVFSCENELPAGVTTVDGIAVHRFPVTRRRDNVVMARLEGTIAAGGTLDEDHQREWLLNTGYSEPLLEEIGRVADRVDALYFIPYLFAATVFGAAVRPDRSIIHPCLHDEPYAYFRLTQEAMRNAAGLVFNTDSERRVAETLLGPLPPNVVAGVGFDVPRRLDPQGFRRRHSIDGDVVAFAGRHEAGKNWELLVEWTALYSGALSRTGSLRLMAMGSGGLSTLPASARPLVVDLGFIDDSEKLDCLATSLAVTTLSLNESFSYLLMEGWLAGVPCIVHADCAVTREHCERGGGGLWVRSVEEFAEALDLLRGDASLRTALARQGAAYVRAEYSWPAVVRRIEEAVPGMVGMTGARAR